MRNIEIQKICTFYFHLWTNYFNFFDEVLDFVRLRKVSHIYLHTVNSINPLNLNIFIASISANNKLGDGILLNLIKTDLELLLLSTP